LLIAVEKSLHNAPQRRERGGYRPVFCQSRGKALRNDPIQPKNCSMRPWISASDAAEA
jgi:hypothetical protein